MTNEPLKAAVQRAQITNDVLDWGEVYILEQGEDLEQEEDNEAAALIDQKLLSTDLKVFTERMPKSDSFEHDPVKYKLSFDNLNNIQRLIIRC